MASTAATMGLLNLLPNPIPISSKLSKTPSSSSSSSSSSSLDLHFHLSVALRSLSESLPLPSAAAASAAAAAFSLPLFVNPQDAMAVGGEFGILEGRTLALVHPLVMSGLFFYTLWAGYLGWQWRRVRTIQDEINQLKKQQVKSPAPAAAAVPAGAAASDASPPPPAEVSPVEAKIQKLTEERKELLKGSYRDRHYNAGSILLGFGVFEAVGGAINTWFRTGKLFPGPHLFAGADYKQKCTQRRLKIYSFSNRNAVLEIPCIYYQRKGE
ncbi:uncharacterized protein LOC109722361 isoform X2 [Ananas comosus]|uniref:Uncharacterized protein LOC109713084 isoform X2 n=1 Tax=Ananas comosus TaxID=4615 RepID=A0A6P5FGP1_ANACO|nr:uncharacterized protein LOC109713084 isoform X2 [Ananas comosus]XP_020105987.1 uncharacterized protein LOC109722361 isoform X2 [Ananas comosus]